VEGQGVGGVEGEGAAQQLLGARGVGAEVAGGCVVVPRGLGGCWLGSIGLVGLVGLVG